MYVLCICVCMCGCVYVCIRMANQPLIWAKKMRLGEKTSVLKVHRNPLNAPKVYRIVMNLRTCHFYSHMCSVVNL